jgi:hypothetical protein
VILVVLGINDNVCSNEQIPFLFVQMNKHFQIKSVENRRVEKSTKIE